MENNKVLGEEQFAVLRKIQEYAPGAVIAGGAARDLFFEKPFRDVDIFIPLKEVSGKTKYAGNIFFEEIIPEILNLRLGCEDTYEAKQERQGNPYNPNSGVVYDCWVEGTNYQFIAAPLTIQKSIQAFDFNLNCIYHNSKKLIPLPVFYEAVDRKTIASVASYRETGQWEKRIKNLQKKYPDFQISEEDMMILDKFKIKSKSFTTSYINGANHINDIREHLAARVQQHQGVRLADWVIEPGVIRDQLVDPGQIQDQAEAPAPPRPRRGLFRR